MTGMRPFGHFGDAGPISHQHHGIDEESDMSHFRVRTGGKGPEIRFSVALVKIIFD
jgi:hypothetical protein